MVSRYECVNKECVVELKEIDEKERELVRELEKEFKKEFKLKNVEKCY